MSGLCRVQQPGVGVDGVDTTALARAGVPVADCADVDSTSGARWRVLATLACRRA